MAHLSDEKAPKEIQHIPATFTRTQTVATLATALKPEPILANSGPILAEFSVDLTILSKDLILDLPKS